MMKSLFNPPCHASCSSRAFSTTGTWVKSPSALLKSTKKGLRSRQVYQSCASKETLSVDVETIESVETVSPSDTVSVETASPSDTVSVETASPSDTSMVGNGEVLLPDSSKKLGAELLKEIIGEDGSTTPTESEAAKTQTFNVVFVTSEVAPWSKTGGLADVCSSLPKALAAKGHRVAVVAPRYGQYPDAIDTGVEKMIWCFDKQQSIRYYHAVRDNVDYIFVGHGAYTRSGNPYGDANGTFGDNQFRFTLLNLAACEFPLVCPINEELYGQDVVFVANDWQAALVPIYLASKYRPGGVYLGARSVMVVHNLYHQGVYSPGTFGQLSIPGHWYSALEWQYPPHERRGAYEEEGRSLNYLKGGLSTADRVITVSPGYAWEVTTPEGGQRMDWLFRERTYHTNGILNGIDTNEWDPETDTMIPHNYSHKDISGKALCKKALQEELGLPVRDDIPMIGFIGRLDVQKGADILTAAVPWLADQDVQLIMLGSGRGDLENALRWAESAYRDKVRGWVGFSVDMAHKITAASDIIIMPSRFEPCGLNQLYAIRYGAIPIAHRTGGLRDTVIDYNPEDSSGTGWTFESPSVQGIMHGVGLALYTYREHREEFENMKVRNMQMDLSWAKAAEQYEKVLAWSKLDRPYCG